MTKKDEGVVKSTDHGSVEAGRPIELPLDLIDEDPQQPRRADNPGFSARSLSELADSIAQRGVKTPISVRTNTERPGRYLVNHGARRLRASRLAGKDTLPVFIDPDYSQADQVVENLHRDGLTAREIADYIGRELSKGLKRKQIAQKISKSAAFVTQHARLLDLPQPVAQAFNAGRVRDVTVVNELATAHQKNPAEVERWLEDERQEITRGSVLHLRQFLTQRSGFSHPAIDDSTDDGIDALTLEEDAGPETPRRQRQARVKVLHRGRSGNLVLTRRPDSAGSAWVQFDESGSLEEVPLTAVRLTALAFGDSADAAEVPSPQKDTRKTRKGTG
ncbi:ParB family chromosome partitioning protein [Pseudoduganella lurida]|uniref:ParB family chromosome partitioning protein n=1 Tax=Pseudoduganella lurida TaxID=1036180 RepID=A0A562R1R6_9BURK|nr:ParB/RepB/Spo0J family partition protein [Pseudoduganella lurida]TWI62534.1 ParB family chromosome partitioning protein [Pseudoduganella lurida]